MLINIEALIQEDESGLYLKVNGEKLRPNGKSIFRNREAIRIYEHPQKSNCFKITADYIHHEIWQ